MFTIHILLGRLTTKESTQLADFGKVLLHLRGTRKGEAMRSCKYADWMFDVQMSLQLKAVFAKVGSFRFKLRLGSLPAAHSERCVQITS